MMERTHSSRGQDWQLGGSGILHRVIVIAAHLWRSVDGLSRVSMVNLVDFWSRLESSRRLGSARSANQKNDLLPLVGRLLAELRQHYGPDQYANPWCSASFKEGVLDDSDGNYPATAPACAQRMGIHLAVPTRGVRPLALDVALNIGLDALRAYIAHQRWQCRRRGEWGWGWKWCRCWWWRR